MTRRKAGKPGVPRQHFTKPYVEGFARWLRSNGYTETSTIETIRLLAGWSDWLHRRGFGLDNIVVGVEAANKAFKGKKSIRRYASAGRLFVRYLRENGTLPALPVLPKRADQWPIIAVFCAWAREQHGIAETTLDLWERPIIDLLKALGDDPQVYTAAALRDFMLERAKRYRIRRLKTYAVALRGYLRFLIATGRCPIGREYPQDQLIALRAQNAASEASAPVASGINLVDLNFRYRFEGDNPAWRPLRAFDDGKQVFIEFPGGIAQGEMPPLWVIGPSGDGQLVNYRVTGHYMIVDRLFAAAELKLGADPQQMVRIVRTDGKLS